MTRARESGLVVHSRARGRVRVRVPGLRGHKALRHRLTEALHQQAYVQHLQVTPLTESVLLIFDEAVSPEVVLEDLSSLLVAEGVGPAAESAPPRRQPARERLSFRRERASSEQNGGSSEHGATPPASDARVSDHHVRELADVLQQWGTDPERGLTAAQAQALRARFGPNALPVAKPRSVLRMVGGQLSSVPVAMLLGSAVVSVATAGIADAVIMLGVVSINAAIGAITEGGAERVINALASSGPKRALLLREGAQHEVSVDEIVPGDLLVLTPGTHVAADARLVRCENLSVDESQLTGESVPVEKTEAAGTERNTPLAERKCMVYRGTTVTGGSGTGVVVATGVATELGHVSQLAGEVRPPATPMQQELTTLGRYAAGVAFASCAAVFGLGALRGLSFSQMLRTGVSLAVAAVPEGLPTVAVTTLALGLRRMREHRVIVRRLDAVETLGAVQVLCLDKTGTITSNRMQVTALALNRRMLQVEEGRFIGPQGELDPAHDPPLYQLSRIAALCSSVELVDEAAGLSLQGSPTESAVAQIALDAGLDLRALRSAHPLLQTGHRAEQRNYMATLHADPSEHEPTRQLLAVKGSPEEVLELCSHQLIGTRQAPLTPDDRALIAQHNERMAGRALRVLGFAYQNVAQDYVLDGERDLIWVGMAGMADPPRPGVASLLASFHAAGIDTVMVTGDQSATAYAIGRDIGISREAQVELLDSTELEALDGGVLQTIAPGVHVFSRVSPRHKLQIVQALQQSQRTVAMTGDGVNDGPALKAANVGIAMGKAGSDAAREVASVVLEQDDLETLLEAVRQGRTIYDDIRKSVHFILATNLSEVLVTLASVAAGRGEALSPMQLLWINLVTDIFPELALAVQPPEADVLKRPPRAAGAPMFTPRELWMLTREGAVLSAGSLAAYAYGVTSHGSGKRASTLAFLSLTLGQLLQAVGARSTSHSIFDFGRLQPNVYVPLSIGSGMGMTLLTQLPQLRRLIGSTAINRTDWLVVAAGALAPFFVNEGLKYLDRHAPARLRAGARITSIPQRS